jgi:hypothetical protein
MCIHSLSKFRLLMFTLAAAPLAALLAGCTENDRDRRRSDDRIYRDDRVYREDRIVVREPPPPHDRVIVREEVYVDSPNWYDDARYSGKWRPDTRDRRWSGGADRNVPRGAVEVVVNRGATRWRADRDCIVWVVESEKDKVLWSGRVYRGEIVDVVPKHDRIFVNGHQVALREGMKGEIRYRIYSDRGRL